MSIDKEPAVVWIEHRSWALIVDAFIAKDIEPLVINYKYAYRQRWPVELKFINSDVLEDTMAFLNAD